MRIDGVKYLTDSKCPYTLPDGSPCGLLAGHTNETGRHRAIETGDKSKLDSGKLRYDLIPPYALEELARVYTIGAAKYEDNGWLKSPMAWGRIVAAMLRHVAAWLKGEERDLTDGQHHLSSVAWCAFTLMEYERRGVGTDDRQK